jgi:hypothetical protein
MTSRNTVPAPMPLENEVISFQKTSNFSSPWRGEKDAPYINRYRIPVNMSTHRIYYFDKHEKIVGLENCVGKISQK